MQNNHDYAKKNKYIPFFLSLLRRVAKAEEA